MPCLVGPSGSANRAKTRHKVAVLHRKARDARLDHAHKTALSVVRDSQAVYAEDIAVSGLARTRLAKSVHDAGWSQLLRLIEEKCERHGRYFARIGRFEPTSQVCSECGTRDGPKPLAEREWTCQECWHGPRPGCERGPEHTRPRAEGEAKRLRRQRRPPSPVAAAVERGTRWSAA